MDIFLCVYFLRHFCFSYLYLCVWLQGKTKVVSLQVWAAGCHLQTEMLKWLSWGFSVKWPSCKDGGSAHLLPVWRGRRDAAMIRDHRTAVRSSISKTILKSIEKHFTSSEGITVEQRGRGHTRAEGKVTGTTSSWWESVVLLCLCEVVLGECRYQRRSICQDTSRPGSL